MQPPPPPPPPHVILGVRRNATREEITTAFRAAALRTHPDKTNNAAASSFHDVVAARDRMLHPCSPSPPYSPSPPSSPSSCSPSSCFPPSSPPSSSLLHPCGTNINIEHTFAEEDFAEGRAKRLRVTRWRRCVRCDGAGRLGKWTPCACSRGCKRCGMRGGVATGLVCPRCDGASGRMHTDDIAFALCPEDRGRARVFHGCGNEPFTPFGMAGDVVLRCVPTSK